MTSVAEKKSSLETAPSLTMVEIVFHHMACIEYVISM